MGASFRQADSLFGRHRIPLRVCDGHIGAGIHGAANQVRPGFGIACHSKIGWQSVGNNVPNTVLIIGFAKAMKFS